MFQRSLGNFGTNYTFLEELFFGISCKIYLVQDSSGKDYALKLFNKNVSQEHFEIELNACRLLCHEQNHDFIRYISSSEDDGITDLKYIVFEYAKKSSLNNYISPENPFDENDCKILFWKICKMVERLHELNFSHRDLNIDNILLDPNYDPKLGDFGSTKYCLNQNGKSDLFLKNIKFYAPPELTEGNKSYSYKKLDIFSLGLLLLYIRTGKQVFLMQKDNVYKYIKKKKFDLFWKIIESGAQELDLTPNFKDLIISMIAHNYRNRPSIMDVINHPWFDDIRTFSYEEFLAEQITLKNKMKKIENSFREK